MTGLDFSKIAGGAYTAKWGSDFLGAKGVIDVPPWFMLDPIQPEDYGGEPIAYLLKKQEVIVNMVVHQAESWLFNLWAGRWASGEVDDDYPGGYNVSSDSDWTKTLILTPYGGASGRVKFTFPYATPTAERPIELASKHFVVPVSFKCVRGAGNYPVKWEFTS